MATRIINDICEWYAHEYENECLIYITNMTNEILVMKIIFTSFWLNIEGIYLLLETF